MALWDRSRARKHEDGIHFCDAWNGLEQLGRIRVMRFCDHAICIANFDYFALLHDNHPIRRNSDHGKVVGDEEIRQMKLALELAEQAQDLSLN